MDCSIIWNMAERFELFILIEFLLSKFRSHNWFLLVTLLSKAFVVNLFEVLASSTSVRLFLMLMVILQDFSIVLLNFGILVAELWWHCTYWGWNRDAIVNSIDCVGPTVYRSQGHIWQSNWLAALICAQCTILSASILASDVLLSLRYLGRLLVLGIVS